MNALARLLTGLIRDEGPIGIDRFMALALAHPEHGYYRTRDPLGRGGDFTTAPEISQMFGELVGLWCAETWRLMGSPARLVLAELGPGRGTLMADALRAARIAQGFRDAVAAGGVHLVETSPVLRERQRVTLAPAEVPLSWLESADALPEGPAIVVANEFLDALPIRQFVRGRTGWHERLVGLGPVGSLAFGLSPTQMPLRARQAPAGAMPGAEAPEGAVLEVAPAAAATVRSLALRLAAQGGAALLIDYGHAESGFEDTLQAVARHRPVDPLAEPGEADLTAHVDFAAMARAARLGGARVQGPVRQGAFLTALGLDARAARLAARRDAATIAAARDRLAGYGPGQMGALFMAMVIADPSLPDLPGFPPSAGPELTRTTAT